MNIDALLHIRFDGVQEGIYKPQYTDLRTRTTFYSLNIIETLKKLKRIRKAFKRGQTHESESLFYYRAYRTKR